MKTMKQNHLEQYYNKYFLPYTDIPFSVISNDQKKHLKESVSFAQYRMIYHYSEVVVDMANAITKMGYPIKTALEALVKTKNNDT